MYQCSDGDVHGLLKEVLIIKVNGFGLKDDIDYCLSLNIAPVVGIFKDGVIKLTRYKNKKEHRGM